MARQSKLRKTGMKKLQREGYQKGLISTRTMASGCLGRKSICHQKMQAFEEMEYQMWTLRKS